MSFSFSAVGTKEEVAAQLAKVDVYGNAIGEAARLLVVNAMGLESVQPYTGYEYKYVVNASGHSGGGSPLSLNMSIVGHYVPVLDTSVPPAVPADPPPNLAAPS